MRDEVLIRLFYCVACLLIGCTPPNGSPSSGAAEQTVQEPAALLDVLRTRDAIAIMNALNSASGSWYAHADTRSLPLFSDLWHRRRDAHPDISWDLMDLPEIRLTIAHQLLQASRNHLTSLSKEEDSEMHRLAKEMLGSSDEVISERAARVLGQGNREEDIDALLALAQKTTSRGVFAAAAEAIASICGERASKALDNLATEGTFRDVAAQMRSSRPSMTRVWCSQ